MATLILTAVGTAVGGPLGAAIGSLIGQQIDQRLFAPKAREGARLGDLAIQGSTYGATLPKIYGTMRVAGTVIWATDLQEDRRTISQGKGRPKATVYSYRASFAVALSARPGVRVGRIWADGKLLRGAAGDFKVTTGFRFHSGREDTPVDPLIAAVEGAGQSPAYRGLCYCVFEDLAVESFGNRIPLLTFELIADDGPAALDGIVKDLTAGAVRTQSPAAFIGYAVEGGTLRDVIEPLTQLAGLAAWDDGRVVRLMPAAPATRHIADQDLGAQAGAEGGAKWTRHRAARSTLPSLFRLGYADPARDFQPGEQRADLFEPGQNLVREIPAALDAATAQQWAMSALLAARSRADDLSLSLPWRHLALVSGEALGMDGAAFAGDWRIAGLSLEAMRVEVRLNRSPSGARPSIPADPGRGVPAPDKMHGPTRIVLAELPWLDPGVARQPLVVVAAAGPAPGWRQANLMQSDASGARWTEIGATAAPAILGTLVAGPGFAPAGRLDRRNSLTVALLHDEMALASCSMDALLAGRNLILVGGELIQFAEAQRIGPALYRLSVLLRGQRGTEDQIGSQAPGADIVLIDRETLVVLDVPSGATSVRILASGVGDTSLVEASIAMTGRAVRPLSPVHLSAKGDSIQGIDLTWTRRSREGWAWPDAIDAPLAEEQEHYRILVQPDRGAAQAIDGTTSRAHLTPAFFQGLRAAGARRARCLVTQLGSGGASPPAQIDLDQIDRTPAV